MWAPNLNLTPSHSCWSRSFWGDYNDQTTALVGRWPVISCLVPNVAMERGGYVYFAPGRGCTSERCTSWVRISEACFFPLLKVKELLKLSHKGRRKKWARPHTEKMRSCCCTSVLFALVEHITAQWGHKDQFVPPEFMAVGVWSHTWFTSCVW